MLILKCVRKVLDSMLFNFFSGFVGDKFELVFVFLFENFKEGFMLFFVSDEMDEFFDMFVLVLFEFY